jgi:ribosomal protein S4
MARRLPSKPRYKISYQSRSKIWFSKDSRLRRFFSIRGRQLVRRRRLFTRFVLVSNKIKWIIARRFLRPYIRPKFARPRRLSYRYNFYAKQRFRAFFGKVEEHSFRQLFKITKGITTIRANSFFVSLESRLDVILYRIRFLPTIFACNQFIRTYGLTVGSNSFKEPHRHVRPGTILSVAPKYWGLVYEHRLTRVFYRVYGKWLRQVRRRRMFAKQFRWLSRSIRRSRSRYHLFIRWARLNRVFKLLRDVRFKNINSWRKLFAYTHRFMPSESFALRHKLDSTEKLISQISRSLRTHGRMLALFRKRRFQSGSSFKRLKTINLVAQSYMYSRSQRRLNLVQTLDQLEQSFYEFSLSAKSLTESRSTLSLQTVTYLKNLLARRKFWLSQRRVKDSALLKLQTSLFLRKRRHRKFFRKNKFKFRRYKKRQKRRGNSVRYFLLRFRYKKRVRRILPRLKKVHWHIPSYRHLNPQTLEIARVRAPQISELYYPFRISPAKIVSFYKSRGF